MNRLGQVFLATAFSLTFPAAGLAQSAAAHQHGQPAATSPVTPPQQPAPGESASQGQPQPTDHQAGCQCCCCEMMRQMMQQHGQSGMQNMMPGHGRPAAQSQDAEHERHQAQPPD